MDEHYFFSPKSLDRARELHGGVATRRSSSSSGRRLHTHEDMHRTPSTGSLPRRLSRYGSQHSLHSQEGGYAPSRLSGHVQPPPVNIPPGSLPARVGHRHSYSTASTSSSPGTFQFQRASETPSPSSRRSSAIQHVTDKRRSWQTSPASNPTVAAFTPPSADFSLGRRGSDASKFSDMPPFSVGVGEQKMVPEIPSSTYAAPFVSESPPFSPQANSETPSSLPASTSNALIRRPSMTFPTMVRDPSFTNVQPSLFTPSSSAMVRPPVGVGYDSSPPPLAVGSTSLVKGDASVELGEFFKTLEMSRKMLGLTESKSITAAGEGSPRNTGQSSSSSRMSKTKVCAFLMRAFSLS